MQLDLGLSGLFRWAMGGKRLEGLDVDPAQAEGVLVSRALDAPVLPPPIPVLGPLWDQLRPPMLSVTRRVFRSPLSETARIALYRKMSQCLAAGDSVTGALANEWYTQTLGGSRNPWNPFRSLVIAVRCWIPQCKGGVRFSRVVQEWAPPLEASMISAGENAGTLPRALQDVIQLLVRRRTLRWTLVKAFATPLLAFVVALAVLVTFSTKIVPAMKAAAPRVEFTGVAGMVFAVGDIVREWAPIAVPATLLVTVAVAASLPYLTGALRQVLDRLPGYATYRLWEGVSFFVSMSAMTQQGVGTKEALMLLWDTATPYARERIQAILQRVRSGRSLSAALVMSGYEWPDFRMIIDLLGYQRSGSVADALRTLAENQLDSSILQAERMVEITKAAAVLLIGAIVGVIAMAFMDMMTQMDNFRRAGGF